MLQLNHKDKQSLKQPPFWFQAVLFGLAYFACAAIANYLVLYPGSFVHFWLPSGLFVGILLHYEKRQWPILFLAAFVANVAFDISNGKTFLVSVVFFIGNGLEALAGASMLRRFLGERPSIARMRDVSALIIFSALLSTMCSAFIGTTVITHFDISKDFWQTWLFWWSGDAVGVLLLAPLLLIKRPTKTTLQILLSKKTEALLSILGLAFFTIFVFSTVWSEQFPLKFLLFPWMVWMAIRFGGFGAILSNLGVAFTAVWIGARQFHALGVNQIDYQQHFIYLQLFLATMIFITLLTASILSERKKAERSLINSEKNLKTIMEMMPIGIAWIDMEGQVEYINRYFIQRFGYSLADIPTLKDSITQFFPDPLYQEKMIHKLNEAKAKAPQKNATYPPLESDMTCKDGTVRHVLINTGIVQNRIIHTLLDITEHKKMQEELLKTQKLESLSILAGGIAHDFNNILTGILGNISFANLFLEPSHKAYQPLERAEKASRRAAELAGQLLTFAKGGSPVKKIICVPVLVKESLSLTLRGANVKGILNIPENLHAIEADEGQISQVCNNIIINAVQAMPSGGTLIINGENINLAAPNHLSLPEGTYIKLSFTDQGCGIPSEVQNKIFDPYFSTKLGGTGLGLASVHSIIDKHGGHIEVFSIVNKGTTFSLYLPSLGVPFARPSQDTLYQASGDNTDVSILVMDDDDLIRDLATGMLTHLGYKVTTCMDGAEAIKTYLEAIKSGQPFFSAIMDLTIPGGMGGKEAAQHILKIDPTACLIVSSGYSNDPVMAEYQKYGFRAAIAKPYKVNEMARILASIKN